MQDQKSLPNPSILAKRKFNNLQTNQLQDNLGKVPPQDLEVEASVLGSIMLDKRVMEEIADVLKPEHFYSTVHQEIYKAISVLFDKDEVIDMLTVGDTLKSLGTYESIGKNITLVKLTQRISGTENVKSHAVIIIQQSMKREMIKISTDTIRDSYEGIHTAFDILDSTSESIYKLSESNIRKDYNKIDILVNQAFSELEENKNTQGEFTGLATGFVEFDRITSGLQNSDLIILAARPGMGKSAFAISLLLNVAIDYEKPVALFSLEMSSLQVTQRMLSIQGEISSEKLKKANLEDHEWTMLMEKTKKLSKANIFIDDTAALTIMEFKTKARRLKHKHDIQLIVVDYLQMMTSGSKSQSGIIGSREQEIAYISRSLKGIAKELNIPIIALAQLSRAVETRGGDKKPALSDLRESGAIEQDADIVSFLYRAEYYKFNLDEEENSTKDSAELIIAKHRNGTTGTVNLRFIGHFTKFANIDEFENLSGIPEHTKEFPSKINLPKDSILEKQPNIGDNDKIMSNFDSNTTDDPGF